MTVHGAGGGSLHLYRLCICDIASSQDAAPAWFAPALADGLAQSLAPIRRSIYQVSSLLFYSLYYQPSHRFITSSVVEVRIGNTKFYHLMMEGCPRKHLSVFFLMLIRAMRLYKFYVTAQLASACGCPINYGLNRSSGHSIPCRVWFARYAHC